MPGMAKIIEYQIVLGASVVELEEGVAQFLKLNQGWKPQAGVNEMSMRHADDTEHTGEGYRYVQAMVREED